MILMEKAKEMKHTHNTLFTNCPSNRQAQTDAHDNNQNMVDTKTFFFACLNEKEKNCFF